MNIKELQIGDWVIYNGYPCRIYSLQGAYPREGRFYDKPIIDVWVGNGFLSVGEDEIEPISLASDILEKNGFTSYNGGLIKQWNQNDYIRVDKLYDYNIYISLADNKATYINIYIPYNGVGIPLRYVHELQRALRLCGLTELADNFTID